MKTRLEQLARPVIGLALDGELIPPELCEVINGRAWFRGEVVA